MAGGLTLRRDEPSDAETVWTLHDRALRADGWEFAESLPAGRSVSAAFPEISETFLGHGCEFLVGHVEGELVTIGEFVPVDEATVEVRRMVIHPYHWRRGHGTSLLVELEERAAAAGGRRVTLETFERLVAAQAPYEARGYAKVYRERHERTGDDRIRSEKAL